MSFFIRVNEEGKPTGYPMPLSSARALGYFENGFKHGELPPDLELFLPKTEPFVDWNEVLECDGELHKAGGAWQYIYEVRPMTADELAAHKAEIISEWENGPHAYASWTYSDQTGHMMPPIPVPAGIRHPEWSEENQEWTGEAIPDEEAFKEDAKPTYEFDD
tara:strand:- start:575 stop:1060 length:486 start_codon:yes stop_codon:yes gene_type:complete